MRIVITGGAGQLAQALLSIVELARVTQVLQVTQASQINSSELTAAQQMLVASLPEALECIASTDEVISLSHQQLDICHVHSIRVAFDTFQPDIVINCAAYNAVDNAETDLDRAMAVNVIGPKLLAEECLHRNIRLVHISTDFVFDGLLQQPYTEQDAPAPLSAYGRTKLEGERCLNEILGAKATIIRTSWLYSCWGNNFVKTMQGLFKVKQSLSVINDQYGSPTWCEALAVVIFMLVKKTQLTNLNDKGTLEPRTAQGMAHLYHYAGGSITSWYELAREIQRQTLAMTESTPKIVDCLIQPITTQAWQGLHEKRLAPRPKQSVLNAEKVCNQLSIKPESLIRANWQQQLKAMIEYQKAQG
ncbi:dTDP-4-dehydrorhamnose reductase [Shewanella schlegeliana]|uniref:dTDP-4-dehydrorhamnose reductase n=1 Tax=Shewanella schlegeliana TaxID=190308 RepID=A0ABS1SSZ1_9GAMM|nr:dTDP-4-dehydrorhamnose reductase [Shewanella schlegeliana]MBL4911654.1 dTDP-4-dehydrorhamnose reductase [Shewanella schlegeliana]MCL1111662.1 dTDP-4-dehydrorhamnose reductase [Shewanella schlegeliana]GIU36965.1 NAD(P)-dependent oxidoreductase [Shewanella schlegeliana]